MTREEYFIRIKEIIEEEYGKIPKDESTKLIDCEMDSFALNMLFITLDSEFNYFGDEYKNIDPFSTIDWANITFTDMLDRLESCS